MRTMRKRRRSPELVIRGRSGGPGSVPEVDVPDLCLDRVRPGRGVRGAADRRAVTLSLLNVTQDGDTYETTFEIAVHLA